MDYVLSKKYDETFTINFVGTEELKYSTGETNDNSLHLTIDEPITGVSKISGITYRIDGVIDDTQYLKLFFKFKNADTNDLIPCDGCWSDLLEIELLSGLTLNPYQPFDFELFVFRVDDPTDGVVPTNIWISNIVILGQYEIDKTDGIVTITNDNNQIILEPQDIYKVFSASDFQVISAGNTGNIDIRYRMTYDNGRSYTQWTPLTTENISTERFNELRFCKMQYLLTQKYPSDQPTRIYDIILIGDFQNVSANYLKLNRYGLRQDCLTTYTNTTDITTQTFSCGYPTYSNQTTSSSMSTSIGYDLKMNFYTQGLSCYMSNDSIQQLEDENHSTQNELWNPYETDKITDLYKKIANDINSIFAWKVDYHLTGIDDNGMDMMLHEYQLYNVIDVKTIKVLVPENKFPDNTIKINKFNLDLFDTFEIHILKDEFKNHFGIDKRPAQNDFLFFCELNRLYRVKHAQVFREIMNAGIYWKVILEKYEQKANIKFISEESRIKIEKLTKNTTLDEIFGIEETDEKEKIANKEQTKPMTHELMRHIIYKDVIIVQEQLYSGNINFADYYYNFKDVSGKRAVIYNKADQNLRESENRSFLCWFSFNNQYDPDNPKKDDYKFYNVSNTKNFNLLNNFNESNKVGYRLWYHKNQILFQINNQIYTLTIQVKTNIWYAVVVNINQRLEKVDMYLYKRPGSYNIKMFHPNSYETATVNSNDTTGYTYLTSIDFKPVTNTEVHNITTTFELLTSKSIGDAYPVNFSHNTDMEIIGSNIKYTNLRVFNDVIPTESINTILSQLIVVDENKLVVADNANRKLYTDNFPRNRWD